jgi:hypothetical protein
MNNFWRVSRGLFSIRFSSHFLSPQNRTVIGGVTEMRCNDKAKNQVILTVANDYSMRSIARDH